MNEHIQIDNKIIKGIVLIPTLLLLMGFLNWVTAGNHFESDSVFSLFQYSLPFLNIIYFSYLNLSILYICFQRPSTSFIQKLNDAFYNIHLCNSTLPIFVIPILFLFFIFGEKDNPTFHSIPYIAPVYLILLGISLFTKNRQTNFFILTVNLSICLLSISMWFFAAYAGIYWLYF